MFYLKLAGVVVLAYLLGSLSFSIIASDVFGEEDIRKKGSGNAGLTNAIRTGGTWVAILTLIGDSLKGVGAVYAAKWIMSSDATPDAVNWGMYVAAVAVVIGHIYPVFFRFRGGKGVLTSAAVMAVLDWRALLVLLGVFLIVFVISGIVSLSSIIAAMLMPGTAIAFTYNDFPYAAIFVTALAIIIIVGHKKNIDRIINGTEKKLFYKKKEKE
ncbi:MAG: glycerol-3-phosphate 1-O-acyltransferase PlsY [Clostridia bacterium]|nr:glycerol-3-phosphate 1-O-acyltransferase PlsY [Clostridia bacterium]MBR5768546.1 glycerol-3-phosphate 1-O-acyltransferase PlsY [Clostridia bacterium]MBR5942525.1 glycerol-3-phosphate 1-O-acyltransferase PlsY [Clostridia bacterium]